MSEIVINEELFDKLIEKALPKEYELKHKDDTLSDDELTYYDLILLCLNDTNDEVLKWLSKEDADKLVQDINNMNISVFDELEINIKNSIYNHFLEILPLLVLTYNASNNDTYNKLNIKQQLTPNDKIAFNIIKWHNYNLISNLNDQLFKNIKQIIYNGVNHGLDIYQIQTLLLNNGLKPIGKFSAEHRARMIAQTELTAIKNTAKLQALCDVGVKSFDIITAKDSKVCSICLSNELNNPYTIEEIVKLIPSHTLCRCLVDKSDEEFTQTNDNIYIVDLTQY